jgi:hypothetical protein
MRQIFEDGWNTCEMLLLHFTHKKNNNVELKNEEIIQL